jgi:hypothetical protein
MLVLGLFATAAPAASIPTPESVLGFHPGEDRKLAGWGQVLSYVHAVDAASPRLRVEEIGRTTQGRPMVMAIVTSEANQQRLEEIRLANARLADPRGLSAEEAERLVRSGRSIVAMGFSIHSTEVGGTLASLRLLHRMASGEDEDTRAILEGTVLLVLPSCNPDGTQLVADWYREQLGTPFEGTSPPTLYHPYVGHDNNRDWYMFTQPETRATVERVHQRWHPQIVHDVHQMGARGARLFVPPYADPWEPNVDGALVAAANALGMHVASRLTTAGRRGIVTGALFDAWTPARAYPHTHAGVRILSETASARLATPIEVAELESRELDLRTASARHPLPWPGGRWTLHDIVEIQLEASLAILGHAAREREHWLRTALAARRRACELRQPAAFVLPLAQRDPGALVRLVEVLRLGEVEVETAVAPFEAFGRRYEKGSLLVRLQQPASGFAKALLERQRYPDLREGAAGPPRTPYDVTAHSLPLLLGVSVDAVDSLPAPLPASPLPAGAPALAPVRVAGRGGLIALEHGTSELLVAIRLLAAGVRVRWSLEGFDDRGRSFPAGTLLVPASARARLVAASRATGIVGHAVRAKPRSTLRLALPRIGLYRSWVPSIDEGWTRFVFEKELGLGYQTLRDRELRPGGLRARFDAIVLPSQGRQALREGHRPGSMPAEYTGGIGAAGQDALREFVEAGGTLVALDAASTYAIEALGLPVRNTLAAIPPGEFFCPGSLLQVQPDPAVPLAHGLPGELPIWFESSAAFELDRGVAALRHQAKEPLLSGYLLGASHLKGRAALAEVPLGKGRVVLFGFRPQYRAQSRVTYPALLNALLLSAAER